MKKNLFLIFLMLLIAKAGYSQGVDSTQLKQVDFMEKIFYGFGAELFAKRPLHYKLDETYVLPWAIRNPYTEGDMQAALDSLRNNARLKVEEGSFSGTRLILETYFPSSMENVDKIFDISFKESSLTLAPAEPLKIRNVSSTSYGFKSSFGHKNGEGYSYNWQTLTTSCQVDSEIKDRELSGSVLYNARFVTDYEILKITKEDTGKTFTLNGYTFKVMDIIENNVVLKLLNQPKEEDFDFEFVNLNGQNHKISGLSFMEMNELKEKDSTVSAAPFSNSRRTTIPEIVYTIFKEYPAIQMEEFKGKVHSRLLQFVQAEDKESADAEFLGPKIIVVGTAGPVDNMFFYCPRYAVSRDIKVEL